MKTKKTLNDFIKEQKNCFEIVKKKNSDYSNKHFLFNFDDFGFRGIIVRIGDKFSRLRTFYSKNKLNIKDEGIKDTLRDLSNYALLCLLKYEEEEYDKNSNN